MYKLYTFFVGCNALVLPLQHFTFISNQIVLTTMKRMLNRMLRYADAIVKRGVDKLIDAIAHSEEPQSKNTVTPQRKKRMRNDTDCATQTTGSTTNCGLTEQAISLMDELYDIRYNVLDRTPEVQRRDQADKGFVPVSKLVRNTMVIDLHKRGCMVWNNDVDRIVESAYMPQYHPFSAYLQTLPQWDGTDRVGPLAERVSTDALWRLVFGRWLRCMVAGWVQATAGGASTCGNAMIPLLVSEEQGVRKSTFCRMLLPPELRNYYTDKFELAGDERLELALSRFALVNLDEFDRYNKLHNAKLKNLVQLGTMQARRPYAAGFSKMARVASFIGTSNRFDLLTDPTGSRRFFCQEVKHVIDCDTPLDYAQLYAQLLHEVNSGEITYFTHTEEEQIQQHNRLYYQASPLRECFSRLFEFAPVGNGHEVSDIEGGEWLTATAILLEIKRAMRGMGQKFTAVALGRELVQLQVPRRRSSKATLYCVRRKHDEGC